MLGDVRVNACDITVVSGICAALQPLLGHWSDVQGSTYKVARGSDESNLCVTTTRNSGRQVWTANLIRVHNDQILWGRKGTYELRPDSKDYKSLYWFSRRCHRHFHWYRIEETSVFINLTQNAQCISPDREKPVRLINACEVKQRQVKRMKQDPSGKSASKDESSTESRPTDKTHESCSTTTSTPSLSLIHI